MNLSGEKGRALEDAVERIENAILRERPELAAGVITIESRKRVKIAGVTHEFDLLVTVDLGAGYRTIFVFECKNLIEKVDKNAIAILSMKVDAIGAQRGFFVARGFTKDARAQAKKDQRLVLLRATELSNDITPVPIKVVFAIPGDTRGNMSFRARHRGDLGEHGLDVSEGTAILHGEIVAVNELSTRWIQELHTVHSKKYTRLSRREGDHLVRTRRRLMFEPGELLVNGIDVAAVDLDIKATLHVRKPAVRSYFAVEGRGRTWTFDSGEFDRWRMVVSISRGEDGRIVGVSDSGQGELSASD